jgi:hypothetical protein
VSQLKTAQTLLQAQGRLPAGIDLQALLGPGFWRWYHSNKNVTLLQVRKRVLVIPITLTVKVKDLRNLFELLFGPEPIETQTDGELRGL